MRAFEKTLKSLLKQAAVLIAVFLLLGFAGPPLLKKYAGVIGAPPKADSRSGPPIPSFLSTIEEGFTFESEGSTLSGTLVLPDVPGPHPAIVILGGSGWRIRQYTHHLTRQFAPRGIATLVFDKRSYGRSGGRQPYSFTTVARDAVAAVHKLQRHPAIDPKQVGLFGASRGGWHAPLAASLSKDIAFLVLFVAPAVTPEEQEANRIEHTMRADGYPEEAIRKAVEIKRAAVEYVFGERTLESYEKLLDDAKKREWFSYIGVTDRREVSKTRWKSAKRWTKLNMRYDPIPSLEKVTCPLIAIFGGLDRNVLPGVNKPLMEDALNRAGNQDFELVVLPNANHRLQLARTGGQKERTSDSHPEKWPTVHRWLAQRVQITR